MNDAPFVLVVEDHRKIRGHVVLQLREQSFAVHAVASAEEAQQYLRDNAPPDLLLIDVRLPRMSGIEFVRGLHDAHAMPPTIVMSGEASISETVEALRLGVYDFIEKPFTRERLLQSVRNCLEHFALAQRLREMQTRGRGGETIAGTSPEIRELLSKIERVAPTTARILIRGETGTGKELVANTVHRLSGRANKPFVKINCAAIPAHLIEDELFGHARGAFTDAKTPRAGLFEEAHGGTLFLDEIGDMNLELQSRLLRVLEDGKVRRIGDTQDRQIDARVVAATNRDLEAMVAQQTFRQDLFFRLSTVPIVVPPLRERRDDIALLFSYYLDRFGAENQRRGLTIDAEVLPVLRAYSWPGNVRELKNVAEQLAIFGVDPITIAQLPTALRHERPSEETGIIRPDGGMRIRPLRAFKAQAEKEYIESVLRRTNWNVSAAARLLEIQRSYLHQKMADLGIEREAES
ncbi:MAG TPA: sigma-54 dependent transcriptional regulator [Thermoanaerobaculia bacterium]|nr:sigma-54 dependent transcriptional regulator [Thermoanaerobaculia bacterium]